MKLQIRRQEIARISSQNSLNNSAQTSTVYRIKSNLILRPRTSSDGGFGRAPSDVLFWINAKPGNSAALTSVLLDLSQFLQDHHGEGHAARKEAADALAAPKKKGGKMAKAMKAMKAKAK